MLPYIFQATGLSPIELIRMYARNWVKGRSFLPTDVIVMASDDPIVRTAHFQLWLDDRFAKLGETVPADIASSLVESLYATEFEAHLANHPLTFDIQGELISF